MTQTAEEIYREVLDALTDAIEVGDAETCQHYLAVPFTMHLLDRSHVCQSRAQIAAVVTDYHANLTARGVTRLLRTVEVARFRSATKIEGYHITTPLRFETPVIEPYAIRSVLEWIEGRWQSTEQEIVIRDDDWNLLPEEDAEAPQAIQPRGRRMGPDPKTAAPRK